MSNFCRNCGAPLIPGAKFCSCCGAAAVSTPRPVVYTQGGGVPSPKPAKRFQKRMVFVVLAFIVGIALGVGFLPGLLNGSEAKPVTVKRDAGPLAAQTASEATAIALRQYIYARLATEAFAAADLEAMSIEEIKTLAEDASKAWEDAERFSSAAEELSGQALTVLEEPAVKQSSAADQPQARFMTLAAAPEGFQAVALAANVPQKFNPTTWAENLTKQYDAIKGAKRYEQLARQLGIDAKEAYQKMQMAQEIIRNQATSDAAFWDQLTKAAQAAKTTSKVGLLGISMIATGGGSVALLEGAGLLVGGVDCIVDVAETGSTILLGDNNQVAVAFGDIKEKLGPASALIGLATLNPSGIGKTAKDTTEALVYITDSLVDLFYEDKIVGVKVEGLGLSEHTFRISGQVFEAGKNAALEAAGFMFPLLEIAENYGQAVDREVLKARLDALSAQMAAIYQNPELYGDTDENGLETIPEEELEEQEPTNSSPMTVGNESILGTYTLESIFEEPETYTITIGDNGNGTVIWKGYPDGAEMILPYNQETNEIVWSTDEFEINIVFSLFGGHVTAFGYTIEPVSGKMEVKGLSISKISD